MLEERRWERFAPLTGVAAVVLWLIAVLILETGDRPGDDSPAREIATYFDDETGRIFFSFLLWGLGTALFVWFLGSLRGALASAEGGVARVASIAFGAGIGTAVFALAFPATDVAGAIAADSDRGISPAAAETLVDLGIGFFVCAEVITAVLFVATALVALRTRVLPVWLAWASIVLAIALFIFPIGWAVLIFGLPLWIIVVSALLFTRGEAPAGEVATARAP